MTAYRVESVRTTGTSPEEVREKLYRTYVFLLSLGDVDSGAPVEDCEARRVRDDAGRRDPAPSR